MSLFSINAAVDLIWVNQRCFHNFFFKENFNVFCFRKRSLDLRISPQTFTSPNVATWKCCRCEYLKISYMWRFYTFYNILFLFSQLYIFENWQFSVWEIIWNFQFLIHHLKNKHSIRALQWVPMIFFQAICILSLTIWFEKRYLQFTQFTQITHAKLCIQLKKFTIIKFW